MNFIKNFQDTNDRNNKKKFMLKQDYYSTN